MCDDSSFRTYYGGKVWYIVYDDSTGTNVNMIAYLYSSHDNSTCAYCNIISDDRYSRFLHSNSNAMIDGAIAAYLSYTIDDGRVAMDRAETFANCGERRMELIFGNSMLSRCLWAPMRI